MPLKWRILTIAGFVTATTTELLGMERSSPARRFVVFIAAFVFALQSYVVQTHIHDGSRAFGGAKIAAGQSPAQGKTPLDHNSRTECPFCQAVVHAGVFVASAPPLLTLPFAMVETVALVFAPRPASGAAAHDWRSRAPPRL
jgi:Protein of unknown function (DUF2946)